MDKNFENSTPYIFKKTQEEERWQTARNNELVDNLWNPFNHDQVNSPAHYTSGRYEAIDVIEDAIEEAPSTKAGFLQAQVLKYLLRLWHKIDAKEDAEKARWYLNRLIDSLN